VERTAEFDRPTASASFTLTTTADNGSTSQYWEETIMKNVEMSVEGTVLTIRVDLSKEFGPSSTGKTIIIASTEGNVTIPNRQEKVGLNVYRKK
jgi:hypothetical protein